MRGLRGCLRAGAGCLALFGMLLAPGAAHAQTAEWTIGSTGCVPTTGSAEQPVSARTSPGLEADTVFVMNDGVTYTPAVHPDTGRPVNPSGTSKGDLTLTLEVLTEQSDGAPWTSLDKLGFDVSAMDEPDPEPVEIEVGVSGVRDVDTKAIRRGEAESAGMVTLLESEALSADDWDRAFGAYAVVAADLVLTTPEGEPWCEVEFSGSTDDPIDEFEVVPSGSKIDAATEANREDSEEWPPYALLAAVTAVVVLGGAAIAARAFLVNRNRTAADGQPDQEERDVHVG
ncbi:hypothetical protein F4561_005960 [Lipingzhangella halophila]|uniref:Uncharacterized protein n=1 Tax=Lipingzhangella halophila TaxID=1783352 RepID=A0A7W7RP79_9ACTN|nr:hypothetical protein [Lipingzhangella halophila]MBB4935066.1 hypothetical protein [Lipingzhangella halophila]